MRIAHIVREFSPRSETFIYDLLDNLEQIERDEHWLYVLRRRLLAEERPYPHIAFEPLDGWLFRLGYRAARAMGRDRSVREVAARVRRLDPDVVHCHFSWAAFDMRPAFFDGALADVPLLVSCHGTDVTSFPHRWPAYRDALARLSRRKHTAFTVHSAFLEQRLRTQLHRDASIRLLNNSCNAQFAHCRKTAFFEPGRVLTLINVARQVPWKGQHYLVRAFATFVQHVYPQSQLVLVGSGPEMSSLRRLARDLGVGAAVVFRGDVRHADVAPFLAAADIYVQPSIVDPDTQQQEGVPIAVLEAISVGLPVIVTNTGGMPEIVGPDGPFSRMVPHSDAPALFRAINELFDARTGFASNAEFARERLARYSPEGQMATLRGLYHELRTGGG